MNAIRFVRKLLARNTPPSPPTPRQEAIQFFRRLLASGAAASIAGNVGHALLSDPPSLAVAVSLAVIPPLGLIAATEGLAKLVRADITGGVYKACVAITVLLGSFAAFLSFSTLADLATRWGGLGPMVSILVPLLIDSAISLSTLALLALNRAIEAEVISEPELVDAEIVAPAELVPALTLVSEPADIPPPPGERRDQSVGISLSVSEVEELERFAADVQMKRSVALRGVLLGVARQHRIEAA